MMICAAVLFLFHLINKSLYYLMDDYCWPNNNNEAVTHILRCQLTLCFFLSSFADPLGLIAKKKENWIEISWCANQITSGSISSWFWVTHLMASSIWAPRDIKREKRRLDGLDLVLLGSLSLSLNH